MQLQHTFKFHYDEALGGDPSGMLYVVNGTEMAPAQVANLPAGVQVNLLRSRPAPEALHVALMQMAESLLS